MITGNQSVAARGLLGWKQKDLSDAIAAIGGRLSVTSITAFEKGGAIRVSNALLIVAALNDAGVKLIEGDDSGGVGVRLARPSQ